MPYSTKMYDRILDRADIVQVIETLLGPGGLVRRIHARNEYKALCPFHAEGDPSFTVTASKQFYHCFGCGVHGNAIRFVEDYQAVSYFEAARIVAKICDIKIPYGQTNNARARRRSRRVKK